MNRLRYSECKGAEGATRGVLLKKVFLETSQNSQEDTYNKVAPLLKKRLWHRCFPVNFVKLRVFYRTPPDDCFYNSYLMHDV